MPIVPGSLLRVKINYYPVYDSHLSWSVAHPYTYLRALERHEIITVLAVIDDGPFNDKVLYSELYSDQNGRRSFIISNAGTGWIMLFEHEFEVIAHGH